MARPIWMGLIGLGVVFCCGPLLAGTEQGALSSQILYSPIYYGYIDTVNTYVYNKAPTGSDVLNYSIYESTPYGDTSPIVGTKAADGGASSNFQRFSFDSRYLAYGSNTISVTLTDTGNNATITQNGEVQVLEHAQPSFYINNTVVNMSKVPEEPPAAEPTADPLAFSATGGGESAAFAAPSVIGDPLPNTPAGELDLDSITVSGDPQISITLQPFTDLPPDNPADSPNWSVNVDTTKAGFFNTLFELNYSDEQDLPGADAPGSEHAYFELSAEVPTDNSDTATVYIVVPEPSSLFLSSPAIAMLLKRRRKPL